MLPGVFRQKFTYPFYNSAGCVVKDHVERRDQLLPGLLAVAAASLRVPGVPHEAVDLGAELLREAWDQAGHLPQDARRWPAPPRFPVLHRALGNAQPARELLLAEPERCSDALGQVG